ncbi:MAG: hypothetical protein HOP15_15615 [Planctomycetes bacterium]|nr:hypothetical protein [Planctomycetota bacterium]
MNESRPKYNANGVLVGFRELKDAPGGGVHRLDVRIGMRLEVTGDERRELAELAAIMHALSANPHGPWLSEFVRAHTRATIVIRGMIDRAQTY